MSTSEARNYAEPFGWWGHRASPEDPISIVELIRRGAMDTRLAAFLWLALEHRTSIFVAATPHEAGKTTMLTALLDFLPLHIELVYLRGWYERFDFLSEDRDTTNCYLLSNEISSHLPTYLWGRGVRRLFEAAEAGYGMAATIHAEGARDVIDLLSRYPLEVPTDKIHLVNLVLTLSYRRVKDQRLRRVIRLEGIEPGEAGPTSRTLAERAVIIGELDAPAGRLISALSYYYGIDPEYASAQFARREAFLERLLDLGPFSRNDVRRAILQYYQSVSG